MSNIVLVNCPQFAIKIPNATFVVKGALRLSSLLALRLSLRLLLFLVLVSQALCIRDHVYGIVERLTDISHKFDSVTVAATECEWDVYSIHCASTLANRHGVA